jgi:predicted DNA-binding transcriptional regulator YafY
MRADRLLAIVLLIQRDGQMTASELATATGVTQRTIYRDVEALSMAGVPIYTQPGPRGGIGLDAAYRSQLNWFTGPELQALLYTGSAAPLAELGLGQAMDHAVLKLLALLPERGQRDAELMRQRL